MEKTKEKKAAIEIPLPDNPTAEIMEAVENAVAVAISETRQDEAQQRAWLKLLAMSARDLLCSAEIEGGNESSMTGRMRLERDNAIINLMSRITRICRSDITDVEE